jgi:DNA-binding SARP family transcriptional activator/predicted ATPase
VRLVTSGGKQGAGADALRLTLFGPPIVTRDGAPVTFDTRKAIAVLARLAVGRRPVPRSAVAAWLWPDADDERARSALRRTLSVAGAVGPALVVDRATVALDPALTWSDVEEFEASAASDEPARLRRAADLAGDRFLAGFALRDAPEFDDWLATVDESLRLTLGSVLDRLVAAAQADGELASALADARRRLELDPLHEPAHQTLIRLLAWTGDRSGAMAQYRSCVRVLDRELGVAPLPETEALYVAIREGSLELPPTSPVVVSRAVDDRTVRPRHPLVGRDAVLERLGRMPGGQVAGLVAEPGFGRTATLDAVVDEIGRTRPVVAVRCHDAESGLAFGVATDVVRRLVEARPGVLDSLGVADNRELGRLLPGLGHSDVDPIDSPGARTRLFDTIVRLVAAVLGSSATRPGLLAVDDAHWADPASADLLGYLARRTPGDVLVLLTWPTDSEPAALRGADVERVALKPLGPDDVATLLTALGAGTPPPELDRLVQRSGGSPRVLHEWVLARSGGDDPATHEIADLVRARLAQAPETTRQVVSAAAVLGAESDAALLRMTSGRADTEVVDALEDAVDRGLLVELTDVGRYDVPYDGVREIVLASTGDARRRLLHGRAADALTPRHSRDPGATPAALVARHLGAAGRDDEAAEWHWRAAHEARDLWAHTEALAELDAAVGLGWATATVHRERGETLVALGRYRDALDAYERAAALTDDPCDLASLEHDLADVHQRLGAWSISRAHLESALDLLGRDGCDDDGVLTARATADLALLMQRDGQHAEAARTAASARDLAEASGDAAALAQSHNVLGVLAADSGDRSTARVHLERSREYADTLRDPSLAVAGLNNLARVLANDGDTPTALELSRTALDLGTRQGDRHRLAALHTNYADLLHAAGDEAAAVDHLKRAAELFADVDRDDERRPEIWKLVAW